MLQWLVGLFGAPSSTTSSQRPDKIDVGFFQHVGQQKRIDISEAARLLSETSRPKIQISGLGLFLDGTLTYWDFNRRDDYLRLTILVSVDFVESSDGWSEPEFDDWWSECDTTFDLWPDAKLKVNSGEMTYIIQL